jgi:ubiquinone/menaquinone biosynthesis C-methylase UbiE
LIDPLLVRTPHKSSTLLDVCGGPGIVADRASELGWKCVVVDLVEEMLQTRANSSIPAIRANATRLPFGNSAVNRIVVRQGLHYLNIPEALSEFARVSDSVAFGHIVAMRPADVPTWVDYFRIASPGRRVILTQGQITDLLIQAGFEIILTRVQSSIAKLGDSIKHLNREARAEAIRVFAMAPNDFKAANGITGKIAELTSYTMWWEFVVARSPLK